MLHLTADNVEQQRTIRPLYANTQATPYGCFLDPEFDRGADILPGMVMTKLDGEKATLYGYGDDAATHEVWGLSALFVAPRLGVNELAGLNHNVFAVWVGDNQSVFEILAPAFDTTATWETATDGSKTPLYVTGADHEEGPGKLTTTGTAGTDKVAAHLIQVVGDNKIIVSLEK